MNRPRAHAAGAHRLPARRRAGERGRPVGRAVDERDGRGRGRRDGLDVRRASASERAPRRPGRSASTRNRTRHGRPSAVGRCCPGEITSRLVPSSLIWSWTSALAPWPSPTVRTTAVIPMRMPSMVRAERSRWVRTASVAVRKVSRQLMPSPPHRRRSVRATTWPSRIWMVRAARAATSASWVISTMVRPSRCSSSSRSEDVGGRGRVEVPGRLVGQDHRRLGHQRPGDRRRVAAGHPRARRACGRPGRPARPCRAPPARARGARRDARPL